MNFVTYNMPKAKHNNINFSDFEKLIDIPKNEFEVETYYLYVTEKNARLVTFYNDIFLEFDLFKEYLDPCLECDTECEKCFNWYQGTKKEFEEDVYNFLEEIDVSEKLRDAIVMCKATGICYEDGDGGGGGITNCIDYVEYMQNIYPTKQHLMIEIGTFADVQDARDYVIAYLKKTEIK